MVRNRGGLRCQRDTELRPRTDALETLFSDLGMAKITRRRFVF
jgi:hypothetical protein